MEIAEGCTRQTQSLQCAFPGYLRDFFNLYSAVGQIDPRQLSHVTTHKSRLQTRIVKILLFTSIRQPRENTKFAKSSISIKRSIRIQSYDYRSSPKILALSWQTSPAQPNRQRSAPQLNGLPKSRTLFKHDGQTLHWLIREKIAAQPKLSTFFPLPIACQHAKLCTFCAPARFPLPPWPLPGCPRKYHAASRNPPLASK